MSLLITATLLSASCAVAAATEGQLDLRLDESTDAELQVTQRFVGQDAADMRQSLDALFGNDDGRLTDAELDAIAQAAQRDLSEQTFPMVEVDGETANVVSAEISFEGAAGRIDSTDDMIMAHDLTLEVPEADEDAERIVTLAPIWPAEITVEAPEAWRLEESTNLDEVQEQDDGVQGQAEADEEVTLTFNTEGAEEEAVGVPSVSLVALVLGFGLLALLTKRRKGE